MKIADRTVTIERGVEAVAEYAAKHPKTLEVFDGLGDNGYHDDEPNRITLADIGRLVIINAKLQADDVPALIDRDVQSDLAAVPVDGLLEEAPYGGQLWTAAGALFDRFSGISGVQRAKRSKLLHAKRPGMFFITDSRTGAAYQRVAAEIADERADGSTGYWEAAQRDIRQPEFVELMARLDEERVGSLAGEPSLGTLSRLRVLDIICWSSE